MLYDDSQVATVNITMDPSALIWMYENYWSDSLHLAQIHFQNTYIDETVDDVGIRIRGNTSRSSYKKSLKLSFNSFVPGREFYEMDKMNLNGEHNDPSIIRSKLCWDYYQKIGVTASRASHIAVYINEDYYGLYVSIEHIDDEFIKRNYDDDSGNLWKCLWPADLTYRGQNQENYHPYWDDERPYDLKTNVEEFDYSELANLIDIINNTNDEDFIDSLEKVLVIPEVLQYFAINNLVGNWDDYWFLKNNFYLYHDPKIDKIHFIPYDYDNSFGIDWFNIEWAEVNPYSFEMNDNSGRPLATRMMGNSQIRNLFTHFLEFYRNEVVIPSELSSRLQELKDMLLPWAEMDDYRRMDYGFDANGGTNEFSASFDDLDYENMHVKHSVLDFVNQRHESLPSQLNYSPMLPEIYHVEAFPTQPQVSDSIFIYASIFDHEGFIFTQLEYTSTSTGTITIPMEFQPIPNTMKIEESDRFVATIPPNYENETEMLRIIAMDSSGNVAIYPRYGVWEINRCSQTQIGLQINEFLAINDENISDNNGEFDDWLEIYNISDNDILLDGLFLTDNPNDLTKWQFPSENLSLETDNFLIIWCDDDEEQGNYHTNFKISGNGEYLAIVSADGITVIDSLSFGTQQTDISNGRINEFSDEWTFFESPTPGEQNSVCLLGDVNYDNNIDILDIALIVNYILGFESEIQNSDMNEDSLVNIVDLVILVELIGEI
jgi:hypothetical protein